MHNRQQRMGAPRHGVNVPEEYGRLAEADESAAQVLLQSEHFRQAACLLMQAIEKTLRAHIFSKVNAALPYFRDTNRSHDVHEAVAILLRDLGGNSMAAQQVQAQLDQHVLCGTHYGHLHNDLRYPSFWHKSQSHSMLDVNRADCDELLRRLGLLRTFLRDLHRIL